MSGFGRFLLYAVPEVHIPELDAKRLSDSLKIGIAPVSVCG